MAEDINISPDMINNLVNMLKNNSNSDNPNTNNANLNNIDFNDIISKISTNADSNNSSQSSQNAENSSIDIGTIMKIKSIMETLNKKDDQKSNLLNSLKPYLRKSKQAKLDQYVNLMKISQITNIFKTEKGEPK